MSSSRATGPAGASREVVTLNEVKGTISSMAPFAALRVTTGRVDYLWDACWNSGRYCPYPSASSLPTGMNRSAAEFMQ
jgi:hypothetical protein